MTPQQIIGLALRLAALWLIPKSFQLWALTMAGAAFSHSESTLLWYILAVLPAVLAVFLWFFPMLVAHKLLPPSPHENAERAALADVGAALAVSLGVWTLITALPHLFAGLSLTFLAGEVVLADKGFDATMRVAFPAAGIQYAIGMVLIIMPRPLARLVFSTTATTKQESL